MELYDSNKVFIAEMGYVKKDQYEAKINRNEYVFVISNSDYTNRDFIDVFSKNHYKYFSYKDCEHNDLAIFDVKNLANFIAKECKTHKKLHNLSIIKKIINGELLNETELKKLLFAINNENIYKILSDNTNLKKTNNSNIKLNYITTLSNKKYKLEPTTGRDIEIKKILTSIALNNKATLLIGERGVGKTSIVDEISYRISKKEIPEFFKNKKIIELNFSILNTDIDSIEENIIEIIERAKIDNLIIFIDGLENINNLSILKILKYEIEKNNLKVIATINSNNIIKIYNDDIFNKIIIDEPDDENLKQIIKKIFTDYSSINNIKLLEEETIDSLILNLIKLTDTENRILSDCSNQPVNYDMHNPGLIIEIIDRIFADAIINNNSKLTIENILYGISSCNRIKEDIKNTTIKELKSSLLIYETYHTMKKLG